MMNGFFMLAQQYSSSDGGAAVAGGLSLFALLCCMILPGVALLGLWVWALVDCATRQFNGNDKIAWILVILLANWIGALIYLFVGRSRSIDKSKTPPAQNTD